MIRSAFVQSNHQIIHRSICDDNFEGLIHHFNSARVADEGKLLFNEHLIHFLTHSGIINENVPNLNNLVLGIVTTNELCYEMEIPKVLRNILESINFDPFEQIEDTVLLLDSVISNLGISNFKSETLGAILKMDSYDEKVYNIARANKEAESKIKIDLIDGKKKQSQIEQNDMGYPPLNMGLVNSARPDLYLKEIYQLNQLNLVHQTNSMNQTGPGSFIGQGNQMGQTQQSVSMKSSESTSSLDQFSKLCKEITNKRKSKKHENLQFTVIEKLKLRFDKEGKVLRNEIVGELLMYMYNSELKEGKFTFKTDYECKFSPNLDKEDAKRGILRAKSSFPIEKSVPLARWQREEEFDDFTFSFWETEKDQGPSQKKSSDIIMDYDKKHYISQILFFFNTRGRNISGNCKNCGGNLVWQSEKQSENVEFTADSSIFPVKIFFHSNRKCQFDVLTVETGRKSNEKFDTEYIYLVETAEIVQ